MIGVYNYTVWLTYMSLLSAVTGIGFTLYGTKHPYVGMFFLMFSGLCDAFDGRVARTKKDRTPQEKAFGIQIDSLSDLVAFGVLPACIGQSIATLGPYIAGVPKLHIGGDVAQTVWFMLIIGIELFYVLAALIRLAWYNVLEEQRQKVETGNRKYFVGLPVTSAALIFPTIMLIQYVVPFDVTPVYYIALLVTGLLFLLKINVIKPGLKGILIMIGIGAAEALMLLIVMLLTRLRY